MTKLKECPFCGELHSYTYAYVNGVKKVQMRFSNNGCPLEMMWFTVEEWNTRTPDPRLKEAEQRNIELRNLLDKGVSIEKVALKNLLNRLKEAMKEIEDLWEITDDGFAKFKIEQIQNILYKHIPEVKE